MPFTRKNLINAMVLEEVCDDYEDLKRIVNRVQLWGAEYGQVITPIEIVEAVNHLHQVQLIAAYDLKPVAEQPTPIVGNIPVDQLGFLYFYLTAEGKTELELHRNIFDDNGMIRNDHMVF